MIRAHGLGLVSFFNDLLWIVAIGIFWNPRKTKKLLIPMISYAPTVGMKKTAMFGACDSRVLSKKWPWEFFDWTIEKPRIDVSKNSGFYPQSLHFNRVFHYKPSILGYPYFRKPPNWGWSGKRLSWHCCPHESEGICLAPAEKNRRNGKCFHGSPLAQGRRSLRVWLPCQFWAQGYTTAQFEIAKIYVDFDHVFIFF